MKILFVFILSFATIFSSNNGYVDDFETGFKYVSDNYQIFEQMTPDQFAVSLNHHFQVPEEYRVKNLTSVLQDGGNTWSKDLDRMLRTLNAGIMNAQTYEDFLRSLTVFENSASNLGSTERDGALLYIRNIRDLMNLLYTSLQYYNQCCDMDLNAGTWWERWGRCASSIIGGVGTGTLAGAAIGTVPVPAIGTVLGAVIGGIAGGLSAAASNC